MAPPDAGSKNDTDNGNDGNWRIREPAIKVEQRSCTGISGTVSRGQAYKEAMEFTK